MLRATIIGILAVGLTSCAQDAANRAAALDQADDAQCRSYGAAPGTPPYIACRTNIASTRQTAAAMSDAADQDLANRIILHNIYGH